MTLADGSTPTDPRLDRLVEFDQRSRNFPVSVMVPMDIKSKTWNLPLGLRLDQGRQGACVGFGITHELAASPVAVQHLDYDFATNRIYKPAQKIDEWPGENYEGTSLLAGTKVARDLGYFDSYHWCFNIEDVMRAITHEGPVVVATNWMSDMWTPRDSGLIESVGGNIEGGHCYLLRGLTLKPRLRGERNVGPVFRLTNSWGPSWGVGGEAYIKVDDMERLLKADGEAVEYMGRRRP